jgi:hypothetical protein
LQANVLPWIETVPGKRCYPMMRFCSPKAGLLDGGWKLPDVESVKRAAGRKRYMIFQAAEVPS